MKEIGRSYWGALLFISLLAGVGFHVYNSFHDSPGTLEEDVRLHRATFWLAAWPDEGDVTQEEWTRYIEAAKVVQASSPASVESMLKNDAAGINGVGADRSRFLLLMHVVFDLPENAPEPATSFAAFSNSGDARNPDGTFNAAWPLAWNNGVPRVVSPYQGLLGGLYRPDKEFRYLRRHYSFRVLPQAPPVLPMRRISEWDDSDKFSDSVASNAWHAASGAPAVSSSDSVASEALRVPEGYRAVADKGPEPYSHSGWAREIVHEKTGIEMVFVPAGEFLMGAPEVMPFGDLRDDASPQHRVVLTRPFYTGRHEVTQGQWQAVAGTTVAEQRDKEGTEHQLSGEGDRYPMYYVSWEECREFLDKAGDGLRLPTEAEWEYACSTGETGPDDGRGAAAEASANAASDGGIRPVDGEAPNGWGVCGMQGNVSEWCADWFANYLAATLRDPTGPQSGLYRVYRGYYAGPGSQISGCAHREALRPDGRLSGLGFRVVRTAQ